MDGNPGPSRPGLSTSNASELRPVKLRSSVDGFSPPSPSGPAAYRKHAPSSSVGEYHDDLPRSEKPLLHRSRSSSDKEAGGGRDGGGEVLFSSGDDSGYGGVDAEDGGGEGLEVHLASLEQKKAIWWKNVIVTAMFILSWYTFATLLSIYNKWMFSPQYYGFSYPLFVTFCHMIVQFCLAGIIRAAFPRQFKPVERPTRQEYVSKIFPTAISTGGDIGLSNLSLKTITLSLYTMCKSSTLIFVLIFAFAFHLEQYSLRLIGVISLISFGVFLMVFNTTSVSLPGIIMVFSASALSGLRWALTETLMHKKAMGLSNPFATIFWLAPLSALTLGVVSALVEDWGKVFGGGHFEGWMAFKTIGVIVLPGAIAFSMVASEYLCVIIQRAGIVPLSIAGIFKEVSTISISAWVFGDHLTELNVIGVVIAVSGIALFTYHKYQKVISSPVPLDAHGQPIEDDGEGMDHEYALANMDNDREAPHCSFIDQGREGVKIEGDGEDHTYPPSPPREAEIEMTNEERADRRRTEFEGWNDRDWDEGDEEEEGEMEVQRLRNHREGKGRSSGGLGRSWGEWWDKEM